MSTMKAVKAISRPAPSGYSIIYGQKHMEMKAAVRQMIDRDINPFVARWEEEGSFPAHAVFKTLGQAGVFGVSKPVEYGGLGLDFSYSIAVSEEMGRISCGAIPMAAGVQTDMSTPALAEFGSPQLKSEFLAPSINGDLVSCIAVSEPHAGSDVAAIRTHARWEGSDLIINGSKMWITNGYQADWACVLLNTNQHQSMHRNKSLVCVRLDEKGVHRQARLKKLGMQSSDTAEIFFDDVRVPSRNIIGEEGRGFVYQMMQFQDERLVTAAVLMEPLQRCIDLTKEYARERRIFGSTVLNQQVVHYTLAELQTELESLRALLYSAVAARVHGDDVTLLASMAKLKAGRLARVVTDSCIQFWGGQGFTWDNPVSQMHRDLRLHSIGAGCDQVITERCKASPDASIGGLIINTCGWINGEGYQCIAAAAAAFEVDAVVVLDHERLFNELQRDLPDFVKIIHQPKSGGVENRSREARVVHRSGSIHRYFYGTRSSKFFPHTFELPFSDVIFCKIGADKLPDSCLPFGVKQEDHQTKVVSQAPSPDLAHRMFAVSPCPTVSQAVLKASVLGFVVVTEVNMEEKRVTLLSPQAHLPHKVLVWTDVKFVDDQIKRTV